MLRRIQRRIARTFSEPAADMPADLVYAPPIRSVALSIGEQDGAASGQVTVMRIDEFLALSRCTGIVNGRWYRVHAPAGYSCRPR